MEAEDSHTIMGNIRRAYQLHAAIGMTAAHMFLFLSPVEVQRAVTAALSAAWSSYQTAFLTPTHGRQSRAAS